MKITIIFEKVFKIVKHTYGIKEGRLSTHLKHLSKLTVSYNCRNSLHNHLHVLKLYGQTNYVQ